MATYYINGYNSGGGTYPYDSPSNGAPNFTTLFSNISSLISDGDIVRIAGGDYIDDSASDIPILYRIAIIGNGDDTPVRVKNDGFGFRVQMDGVYFNNVTIEKDNYVDNTMIDISSNYVIIENSSFKYNTSTGKGSVINLNKVSKAIIRNNNIIVPSGSPIAYGIYAETSDHCEVSNNVLDMNGNNGHAITFLNGSCYNTISYNIIGDFDSLTENNIGIILGNREDYNVIEHNVVGVAGPNSSGIVYGTSNIGAKGVVIQNNLIAIREDDFGCTGIFIPYAPDNTESYFTIINNIISYRPTNLKDPTVTISSANDSVALNINIQRGIIDYNNIYGYNLTNIFVNNGAPDIIKELGDKTIFVDPKTVWTTDNDKYENDDIRKYYLSKESECIGAGYLHRHIGVGVDVPVFNNDTYINIVDTVTNDFGVIDFDGSQIVSTFFNSVFTEKASDFNFSYRESTSSASPYPSDGDDGVYFNQWEHNMNMSFPFTEGDHFYNKDFVYVLEHKGELEPFDGIKCPANPGYGFSAYDGYETGLWGFPRIDYRNGCFPDPCIIQDSFINEIRIEDDIENVDFWILDKIDPDCLDETGDVIVANNPPEITVLGKNPLNIYQYSTFTDVGATAFDIEDGDITWKINSTNDVNTSVLGQYTVFYTVTDSGGLQDVKTRTVNVVLTPDTTKPIITILGNNPERVIVGGTYTDEGATAWDNRDGDITSRIVTTNNVNSNVLGRYSVVYTVTDSAGNRATATRYVDVVNVSLAMLSFTNGSSIYVVDTVGNRVLDETVVVDALNANSKNKNDITKVTVLPECEGIGWDTFNNHAIWDWGGLFINPINGLDLSSASSLRYIGPHAFSNWFINDTQLVIPESVIKINNRTFGYWEGNNKELILPSSGNLTEIESGVFTNWTSNNKPLNIPGAIKKIGYTSFNRWLVNEYPLGLNEGLEYINDFAFQKWEANDEPLVIPSTVTYVGEYAFSYWESNTHPIEFKSTTPPTFGEKAFINWSAQSGVTIIVPNGADFSQWKSAFEAVGTSFDNYKQMCNPGETNCVLWDNIP